MRAALWLLGLFAVAVAIALIAGNNQGVVSVFWPPYRVDISVNLALISLAGLFMALHVALRALSFFVGLPLEAGRWRQRRREQAVFGAFLDALAQLQAGRFSRARKLAETAIELQDAWAAHEARPPHAAQLRVLSHLVAAESLQSLQDRSARDGHVQALQALRAARPAAGLQAALEGAQIRAARWSLDERDAVGALRRLDELPQGAARRILALRIRLKAARLAGQTALALETTRSLIRHRAFSETAAGSLVRGLAIELIRGARDAGQLKQVWDTLEPSERAAPELAVLLGQRMQAMGGERQLTRLWLEPAWQLMLQAPQALELQTRLELVRALEDADDPSDPHWLARIEEAQRAQPLDAGLLYLAGAACMKRLLWGKAQQHLRKAAPLLPQGPLRRRAWTALAELAEQRGDADAALLAWKQAALAGTGD
jgi:HemY protein